MRVSSILFGVCLLAIPACGGSSSGGSSSVSGTAGGKSVPTTDTVGVVGTQTQTVGTQSITIAYAAVSITNVANTCSAIEGHHNPANTSSLSFVVASSAGTSIAAGTYAIGATTTTQVSANYGTTNAACAANIAERATSGTIKLTTVSSTTVQGTFDVTMDNGDHLSGSFTGPVCNVPLTNTGPATACGS
jgi:hypothetical protein